MTIDELKTLMRRYQELNTRYYNSLFSCNERSSTEQDAMHTAIHEQQKKIKQEIQQHGILISSDEFDNVAVWLIDEH